MKVAIATCGSRGDLDPYLALGHALTAAGHRVALAAPHDFAPVVKSAGIEFVGIDFDVVELRRSSGGAAAARRRRAGVPGWKEMFSRASESMGRAVLAITEDADVLVAAIGVDDYALAAAQARKLPLLISYIFPLVPTAEFPQMLISRGRLRPAFLGRPLHRFSYHLCEKLYWQDKKSDVNRFRRSLGLAPASGSALMLAPRLGAAVLHAYSGAVVPRPADWGPHNIMTGYWRLSPQARARLGEAEPPAALVEWLAAGPPPVFLGFGSVTIVDPAPIVDLAVEAARRTGCRLLLGAGWTDLSGLVGTLPEFVHAVDVIDHDWLFPRCAAVVHQGGSGTTATGLIAGRPTWVYSLFFDQPFWGTRVAKLGVGGHNSYVDLTADRLAESLRQLRRDDVRRRAAALGERLRREDGVAVAMRAVTEAVAAGATTTGRPAGPRTPARPPGAGR